jgi:bifunctional oligoribonuclease and PAP phosphatase NrnA
MKIEKKIERTLLDSNSFVITTHVSPDGDAISSELLLNRLLKRLGKKSVIVNADLTPPNLKFLPQEKSIKNLKEYNLYPDKFDLLVTLDTANPDRTGEMAQFISDFKYVLNIDHHVSNSSFGDLNWIDKDSSSVGEMIYSLYGRLGLELDYKDALLSYVAIATDTGYFRHRNTASGTHRIAASLLDRGVDPSTVYSKLFENKSLSQVRTLASLLSRIEQRGSIGWASVSREDLRKNSAEPGDLEGLVDSIKILDGIKVAVLFQELKENTVKIGLRSKDKRVDVNKIAALFGGGGHKMASGCRVRGDISRVRRDVLAKVSQYLGES